MSDTYFILIRAVGNGEGGAYWGEGQSPPHILAEKDPQISRIATKSNCPSRFSEFPTALLMAFTAHTPCTNCPMRPIFMNASKKDDIQRAF